MEIKLSLKNDIVNIHLEDQQSKMVFLLEVVFCEIVTAFSTIPFSIYYQYVNIILKL